IYNPYVGKYGGGDQRWGANSLFQRIWNGWFGRVHPDGSLLRARGQAGIWLLRNGKRSAFLSRAAFAANYDSSKVIVVDPVELENYAVGPALRFPEPSLIQMTSGGMYLLVNNEKRPIASKEVLRNLGYNPEEIIRRVKPSDLEAYPKGAPVTEADVYPTGRLLQSRQTGAIVYVDNANVRHTIYSKEILRSRFKNQRAERVSDNLINALPSGDPVYFRDGEIVASRTTGKVYIISNGQRRRIPNAEAFRELGYKSKNIIKTNDRSIDIHPEGEPLNDITD
ncbi:MAG: hypothetical protein HY976_01630, partial [Candidatus Kerfeldbacteria bacterium]|nr:hypothetical protein [Candidatus Kerfeldbacteria bacterium]